MERKEKFTPGPWKAHTTQHADWVTTDWKDCTEQINICDCGKHNGWNDVYVIAAAPEMYEMLDKCEGCIRKLLDGPVDDPVVGEAENTVAEIQECLKKARGEE